jgi:GNAT superfamily N-acetyltransferase
MNYRYRQMLDDDLEQILNLSVLAFAPVFASFSQILGPAIFTRIYPDWQANQRDAVDSVCRNPEHTVWVADLDGALGGYIAYSLNTATLTGGIEMLAVHPDHQNRGVGTTLNELALARMREAGMTLAIANTGGDPGHAPARRSYEKAGYIGLPLVHYCQVL